MIRSVDSAELLASLTSAKSLGLSTVTVAVIGWSLKAGSVGMIHAISPSTLPPNGTAQLEKQSAAGSLIA